MTHDENHETITANNPVPAGPPPGSYQAVHQRRGTLGEVLPDSSGKTGGGGPKPPSVPALPALDDAITGETRANYDDLSERIRTYRDGEAGYDAYRRSIETGDFDAVDAVGDAANMATERGELLSKRSRLIEELQEFAPAPTAETKRLRDALPSDTEVEDRLAARLNKAGFAVERRSGDGPYCDTGGRAIAWNGAIRSHKEFVANSTRREDLKVSVGRWEQFARDLRGALDRCDAEARSHRRAVLAYA